ncbi:hypothetical protein [Rheinheimera sp. KL1]|uniref:hypothetical protein n=1 Tax=Rheinheimera sp. KL1 TaxID=1635005 RepID=UPI00256F2020|nr:hypothetical protein [Rheinheimera sp. KL1]
MSELLVVACDQWLNPYQRLYGDTEKAPTYVNKCEISCDRKTLKVIDASKDTNSYYSVSGLILFPVSGIVSGAYVAINNIYHLGEETIVCG